MSEQKAKLSAHSTAPHLPTPPQMAEAEALLETLQEIQAYLKSINPHSELSKQSLRLTQKLSHKLKQSQQRVQTLSPQPHLYRKKKPAPAPKDNRKPEHIQIFTSNLGQVKAPLKPKAPTKQPMSALPPLVWIDRGPEVMCLQQLLQTTGGLENLALDGVYEIETANAVRQWQRDHGLLTSGYIDERTRPVLNQSMPHFRALQQVAQELALMQLPKPLENVFMKLARQPFQAATLQAFNHFIATQTEQQKPVFFFQSLMSTPGQAYMVHEGAEVEQLQSLLQQEDFDVKCTARFDLSTFIALKTYQQERGLLPTGQTDPETLNVLNRWVQHALNVQKMLSTLYERLQKLKIQQTSFVMHTKTRSPQTEPLLIEDLQKMVMLVKQHLQKP